MARRQPVYTESELKDIVAILELVLPASGLPVAEFARPDFAESFRVELKRSGLITTARYFAGNIEAAARHALAAYDETEGRKARAKRSRAGRLARELKTLIEDPALLQNYVVGADLGRLLESDDIANILNSIEIVSYRQVRFSTSSTDSLRLFYSKAVFCKIYNGRI